MLRKFTDLEKKKSIARPPYILLNSQLTCKLLVLGRLVLYMQLNLQVFQEGLYHKNVQAKGTKFNGIMENASQRLLDWS